MLNQAQKELSQAVQHGEKKTSLLSQYISQHSRGSQGIFSKSGAKKTMGALLLLNRNKSIFCKSFFDALDALHAIVAGVQLDNHLINA